MSDIPEDPPAPERALNDDEAGRLGAVAWHQGKTIDDCPFDQVRWRGLWLKGFNKAQRANDRYDKPLMFSRGGRAYSDGVLRHEHNLPQGQARWDWLDGWDDRAKAKRAEDERRYS